MVVFGTNGRLVSKRQIHDFKAYKKCFEDGELSRESTVAKFATVQNEGVRQVEREIDFYSLDVIISVGYRVKS